MSIRSTRVTTLCFVFVWLACCQPGRRPDQGIVSISPRGFEPLFNGKDFSGWEGNLQVFRVEDGAIVGGSLKNPLGRNEFLCTTKEFSDFELRLEAKLVGSHKPVEDRIRANAGIQVRSVRIPNHHEVSGYQVDMAVEPTRNIWGSLYDESRRREMLVLADQDLISKIYRSGDWNEFVIRCRGDRIQLWMNGRKTVDFIETQEGIPRAGIIGLQIHSGPPSEAWYRNIRLKELPASRSRKALSPPREIASNVERARDPWIFRLNLDDRPRMVVLALNENMWAAYDAQMGGLYRVWREGIHFTGPLWDKINAAQPRTLGSAYLQDPMEQSPWRLLIGQKETVIVPEFNGYRVKNNTATLRFTLPLDDDPNIIIEETPEFITHENRLVGLERVFTTQNVPDDVQVALAISYDHMAIDPILWSTGPNSITAFSRNSFDWGNSYAIKGNILLNSNGPTRLRTFFDPRALPEHDRAEEDSTGKGQIRGDGDSDILDPLARVKLLIGKNNCVSCHSMTQPQIGPSYTQVAQKYDNSLETIQRLIVKVKAGGYGVWGQRPMTPHPFLSPKDAEAVVTFILSLDSGEHAEPRPGVVVDYYDVGVPLARLPDIVPGQNPNLSKVYPVLDLRSGNPDLGQDTDENFEGFDIDFVIHASGFLNIRKKQKYDIRLIANNGGSLTLDGEEILNGYRYEGTYRGEKTVTLDPGPHPFSIKYYHHLFAKALILQWRSEGEKDYTMIPDSVFTHSPYNIKPTSPGLKEIFLTRAPGFGASLEEPHTSYDLSSIRPEGFEPRLGGLHVMPDGRLVISTWDGQVYLLEHVMKGDPNEVTVTRIADGLYEPLGITSVEGEIYVFQKWELTHLVDRNGDGFTDEYRVVADDWGATGDFHEWSYGLIYRDGYFYATLGIAQGPFRNIQSPDRGTAIRIAMDGSYDFLCHGLREANGIGFGVDGEIFITDNEGQWLPTNKLMHVREDEYSFFGNRAILKDSLPNLEETPPALWLPLTEITNSPTQPILLHGGPYEGQMIFGDITHGGIKRVFMEKVMGKYQGAVFRFAQGLEVGIMRMEWGPDGSLYIGGLGGDQDFNHRGHRFGLQRLTYNGKTTFEMLAVRARSNGMEIEFTEPLRMGDGEIPSDYLIQQWWYKPTASYGGDKLDLENLAVRSVTLSENRKKVFLELEGMKKGHVIYVKLQSPILSATNQQIWSNETWYTLNVIPKESGKVSPAQYVREDNTLNPAQRASGWRLLFDGESTEGWHVFNQQEVPKNWQVSDGNLLSVQAGASILTDDQFDSFELELDWRIDNGGESGIHFHVVESGELENSSQTGPEMQIIDDLKHPDAQVIRSHLSGASYDLYAPRYRIAQPPGEYNHARIVVDHGRVEHWLNGIRVVQYELGSEDWETRVSKSMFANEPRFGRSFTGHIALQSHGGEGKVWFKNVRIRPL